MYFQVYQIQILRLTRLLLHKLISEGQCIHVNSALPALSALYSAFLFVCGVILAKNDLTFLQGQNIALVVCLS